VVIASMSARRLLLAVICQIAFCFNSLAAEPLIVGHRGTPRKTRWRISEPVLSFGSASSSTCSGRKTGNWFAFTTAPSIGLRTALAKSLT